MWLKLIGGLLIVVVGIVLGFRTAGRFVLRPRQIRNIIVCIASLKSLINYGGTPLAEALIQCAQGVEGPIRALFVNMSELLTEQGWMKPHEALAQALTILQDELALENPEQEALLALGNNLGSVNCVEQAAYINMVLGHLERIEQEAITLRDCNVRMYRYLGICGGLATVILLI